MASIRQRQGKWQARIRRKGYPAVEKSFSSRQDAEKWARQAESEMDRGTFVDRREAEQNTFADILLRYKKEVTPLKKGSAEEEIRLDVLARSQLGKYSMTTLSNVVMTNWRNQRLQQVSGSTVNRELNIISSVINTAMREWGIAIPHNPVMAIKRPASNPPRVKRLESEEEFRLLAQLTVVERAGGRYAGMQNQWMKPLVLLALETAMRQGELLNLRWEHINLSRRTAQLLTTKNGDSRTVPLSTRAVEILSSLPRSIDGRVLPLTSGAVKQAFSRACTRARVSDVVFHTLRHEAISRLFERGLNPMEVATISGHKTLAMLKRYTHLRAEDLALKLG